AGGAVFALARAWPRRGRGPGPAPRGGPALPAPPAPGTAATSPAAPSALPAPDRHAPRDPRARIRAAPDCPLACVHGSCDPDYLAFFFARAWGPAGVARPCRVAGVPGLRVRGWGLRVGVPGWVGGGIG